MNEWSINYIILKKKTLKREDKLKTNENKKSKTWVFASKAREDGVEIFLLERATCHQRLNESVMLPVQ